MDGGDKAADNPVMADPRELEGALVRVDFTRGPDYHVYHADGAWGGVTPSGGVNVAFYAEWRREPEAVQYTVTDGKLKETGRIGTENFTREIQAEVMLTFEAAKALHGWLERHLKNVELSRGSDVFLVQEDTK